MNSEELVYYKDQGVVKLLSFTRLINFILSIVIAIMQIIVFSNVKEPDLLMQIYFVHILALFYFLSDVIVKIILYILERVGKIATIAFMVCCYPLGIITLGSFFWQTFSNCFGCHNFFLNIKLKTKRVMKFIVKLLFILFGVSLNIACIVFTSKDPTLSSYNKLCIALVVLHSFRIFILIFMFIYCDLFNPGNLPASAFSSKHDGFLRLEELDTGVCIAGKYCISNSIEHILKCHKNLHIPTRWCNPIYLCANNYYIGFHQTNVDSAMKIAKSDFRKGSEGMFGGGIYFARSIHETNLRNFT